MATDDDKLTCVTCGARGVGIGFAHDCAIVLHVEATDGDVFGCANVCGRAPRHPDMPTVESADAQAVAKEGSEGR